MLFEQKCTFYILKTKIYLPLTFLAALLYCTSFPELVKVKQIAHIEMCLHSLLVHRHTWLDGYMDLSNHSARDTQK